MAALDATLWRAFSTVLNWPRGHLVAACAPSLECDQPYVKDGTDTMHTSRALSALDPCLIVTIIHA